LYVNCVWDEHLVSNPEVSTNFAYKTAWVRDHLNHENDMSATSYDKFSNRLDVNERVMSVARKHNEKFIENDKSRIKAITEMLNSDSVQSRKVLIKAFTFIIQKLEENSEYEITNYSLRMAIPKPEGGFKPVCKPAIIKEIVEMLSEKKLDKPH
jgi:hypothetical protein